MSSISECSQYCDEADVGIAGPRGPGAFPRGVGLVRAKEQYEVRAVVVYQPVCCYTGQLADTGLRAQTFV